MSTAEVETYQPYADTDAQDLRNIPISQGGITQQRVAVGSCVCQVGDVCAGELPAEIQPVHAPVSVVSPRLPETKGDTNFHSGFVFVAEATKRPLTSIIYTVLL